MKREDEERLVERMEHDAVDNSAWEDDPTPEADRPKRLAAQVTLRLDPDRSEQLRHIARVKNVAYTRLLREWIEERLADELAGSRWVQHVDVVVAGSTGDVQVTGQGRLLEEPAA